MAKMARTVKELIEQLEKWGDLEIISYHIEADFDEKSKAIWDSVDDQEDEEWDEPDNIDDDCGFDPYMGCYSDDC